MEHPAGRCGITFEKFQDIKEGDTVEAYVMEQIEVQSYPTAGRAVSPALLSLKREQAKKFCAKLRFASFVSVGGGTARPGGRALQAQSHIRRREQFPIPSVSLRSTSSLPLLAFGHFPLRKGVSLPRGRFVGRTMCAPTAETGPGTLARQSQAPKRNRTSGKFCTSRAQWPGWNLKCHSDFARRK